MNIGFDAKRYFHNRTGLGNYSRTLVLSLAAQYPEHQYHLFTPSLPANAGSLSENVKVHLPEKGNKLFWRSYGIWKDIEAIAPDVYHGLSNELPFTFPRMGIPGIVTIHDLIFKHFPDQYGVFDRNMYDMKSRFSCRIAHRVSAASESTKNDIVNYYEIDPQKIVVIYQACDDIFYKNLDLEEKKPILKKYTLPKDYILYVGSIIERKRLLTIVKALGILKSKIEIPLVIVGKGEEKYLKKVRDFISQNGMEKQVHFLEDVPSADLPALYQQAAAFVYPSVYEGFGIPVLEAMVSRTPVITGNRSSLPEVGGPDSRYVDPGNPEELAEALEQTLTDTAATKGRVLKSYNFAEKFRQEKLTQQLMALYQSLV